MREAGRRTRTMNTWTAVALAVALSLPALAQGGSLPGGAGSEARAADGPITVSGSLKPMNRDVELAVDPETGNGLAVWSQNKKKQTFGHIWAAELIRQPDGSYEAGKPFRVSTQSPAQRPTVEFLPEFGFYMILWDEGARDPDKTTKPSRIMSRLYEPDGNARKAAGDFGPEVAMTFNGAINLEAGLEYIGPSSIFERVVYRWWEPGTALRSTSRAARAGRGASKNHSDVTKEKQTLHGSPKQYPTNEEMKKPHSPVVDTAPGCPGDLICYLHHIADMASNPLMGQFFASCMNPNTLTANYVPLGPPVLLPGNSLTNVFGSFRRDGNCDRVSTPGGVFDILPNGTAQMVPSPADTLWGDYFFVNGGPGPEARAIDGEGYVYHRDAKGTFEYRSLQPDGDLDGDVTQLWKIKKRRLRGMDVVEVLDTVLVAWGEAKNKRGTKSQIRLGWFVPE